MAGVQMLSESKEVCGGNDRFTVLIVEDDDGMSALMAKQLRANGYRIHRACDGSEAIEWLAKNIPDLILLDQLLGDMTGKEMLEKLSATDNAIPFVVVSGQDDQRVVVEMMKAGALDYIVKDTMFLDLLGGVVRRSIGQIRQKKELAEREDDLVRALRQSRRHEAEVSALLQASRAVLKNDSFNYAARAIFDSCKKLIGAQAGYVALLSDGGSENEVLFLDSGGRPCFVDPELPMPVRGLRQLAYIKERAVYENDFANSKWVKFLPDNHVTVDNVMFSPIKLNGEPIGLIGLANKPDGFDENDVNLATAFGEIASIAYEKFCAWESLEQSEKRYRSVTQSAVDAIISADCQGNIASWNFGAKKIFGYTGDEVIGKSVTMLMPDRYAKMHEAAIGRVRAGGETCLIGHTLELHGKRKDGSEFPLALSLSNWQSGDDEFYTGIIRDITEQKENEEKIAELARFPEENSNPVLRVNSSGDVSYYNMPAEYLLEQWECMIEKKLPGYWQQFVVGALKSGLTQLTETECGDKAYSLTFAPVVESDYVNIYGYDITERKHIEEMLVKQRYYLEKAQEMGSIGTWELDILKNELIWTDESYRIFGIPTGTELKYEIFLNCVHPDDRESVDKQFKAAITGKPYDIEHRVLVDGQIKWVREKAKLHFDENGKCVSAIGFTQDITERKNSEIALVRAREEIRKFKTIADDANCGIVLIGADGLCTYVNSYFAEVHGYTVDEAIGKSMAFFHNADQIPQALELFEKLKRKESFSAKEIWHSRKDGAIFPMLVNGITITDDDGNPLYMAKTSIDISENKWASDEVERLAKFPDEDPNPVLRISADGVVIYGNKAGEPLLNTWQCRSGQPVPATWRKIVTKALMDEKLQKTEVTCSGQVYSLVFTPFIESGYVNVYAHNVTDREEARKELDEINKELEGRVKKRTSQLQSIVIDLQSEVTERIKAERKILNDQKQLRHLASELLLIEERERRKVATGLHDSIGQILAFSSIELANTLRDAPERLVKPLSHIRRMIEQAITETRDLTFDLSPSVLYTFGLAAAIEQLVEQFSEEHGFRGDLQLNAQPDSISEEVTILLYRSVRELLVNIAKHAKAENVCVEFSLVDEHFEITIEDDGKGFDIKKLEKASKKKNRFGLLSVRERLSHFNGQFDIQSNPGEGTIIKLAVPIEDKSTLKTRRH